MKFYSCWFIFPTNKVYKYYDYLRRIDLFYFSLRLGDIATFMAAVDLRMAVYRGRENSARKTMLHSIYRDESLHHIRHSYRSVLCSRIGHVFSLLAYMARDRKTQKGSLEFAGEQTGRK